MTDDILEQAEKLCEDMSDGMDENLVRGGDEGCPKHV